MLEIQWSEGPGKPALGSLPLENIKLEILAVPSKAQRRNPVTHSKLDVRVRRVEGGRMGFFVNPTNEVVEIDEGGACAKDGLLKLGDLVLAVDGVTCSAQRTVGQICGALLLESILKPYP